MATIALTGATGFVGSKVLKQLNQLNDSGSHQTKLIVRKAQADVATDEQVLVDSIDSKTDWSGSLTGCDAVIHCAARVHVMSENAADPLAEFREINTHGTLNLARSAAAQGVKRFVFVSSIKVMGEGTDIDHPYHTDIDPAPVDPYGISKHEAEQGLFELAEQTGMEVVIIRPPLIYGPGVKANFQAIMKLAAKGIPLPFGMVKNNRRSMVFVGNLVDLIITCLTHPKAANQAFLVSDDDDLSTARFVKLLGQACGKSGFQLPVPVFAYQIAGALTGKKDVIKRLCGSLQVDISPTKTLLDWQPPYSVEKGFAITTAAFLQAK